MKLNKYICTNLKCFSAFCLGSSVLAYFADSAQAASFAGELTIELLYPQNLPNGVSVGVYNRIISTGTAPSDASGNGQGRFIRDTNNVITGETVSGSTDPIVPGEAKADIAYISSPSGTNNTDSVVNIPYTVNYKYNIQSSVSGSGLDNSSLRVSLGGLYGLNGSSSTITGNGSKEESGTFDSVLTLMPHRTFTGPTNIEYSGQLYGSANTAVPSPSSALATLVFGTVSAIYLLRRQLKKQKS